MSKTDTEQALLQHTDLITRLQVAAAPAVRYQVESCSSIACKNNFSRAAGIDQTDYLLPCFLICRGGLRKKALLATNESISQLDRQNGRQKFLALPAERPWYF